MPFNNKNPHAYDHFTLVFSP